MYPRSELFITSDNPEAGTPASRNAPRSVDELRRIIGKTLDEAARNRQIGHPPRSENGAGRAETPEAPRRPQPHIDTARGSWRRWQPGAWLLLGGLILAPLLIVWNAVTAVTLLYQGNFAARAAEPQLNSMGAAIREVLAEHQREMEASHGNRQATSTAFSAGMDRLCGESLHAAPARASEINLAGDASSRACLMRSALSANMAVRERMAVEAAVEGYLYKSLWYLESIRVPVGERDGSKRMLDAVAGIIAGLLCLALLRRHAPANPSDQVTPEDSGPARELDHPGLFFFCDVFDRTPVDLGHVTKSLEHL